MAGIMGFFSDIDPTKVKKADESKVRQAQQAIGEAGKAGQDILKKRMEETVAPTVERVKGPEAGKIDTGFIEQLRGQLPSGQAALQQAQGMQAQRQAQTQAQEATGLLREAAMGEAPSAAQLQQQRAFEQAISAQTPQIGRAHV